MKIVGQHIDEIHFRVNNTDYTIKLARPVMVHPYEEMHKSVKKEVERYMFDNGIHGTYKLYLL